MRNLRYITLFDRGMDEPIYVRIESIDIIRETNDKRAPSSILVSGQWFHVKETLEEIKEMMRKAYIEELFEQEVLS